MTAVEDVITVAIGLNTDVARNQNNFIGHNEVGDEIILLRSLDNKTLQLCDFQSVD